MFWRVSCLDAHCIQLQANGISAGACYASQAILKKESSVHVDPLNWTCVTWTVGGIYDVSNESLIMVFITRATMLAATVPHNYYNDNVWLDSSKQVNQWVRILDLYLD